MRVLEQPAAAGTMAPTLVILLPGALQQPEDFITAGFVDAVRVRNVALDLALVDPELRYVGEAVESGLLEQLGREVVSVARRKGYQNIWLGGISIGGLTALHYAARSSFAHAVGGRAADDAAGVDMVDGLCLLSPYPGSRMLTGEIAAAGGLDRWPDAHAAAAADGERESWQWLKARRAGFNVTPIYLGHGMQDRFADGQQLMARALEIDGADQVNAIAGGHDWPAWLQLWEDFLLRMAQGLVVTSATTDNAAVDTKETRGTKQ